MLKIEHTEKNLLRLDEVTKNLTKTYSSHDEAMEAARQMAHSHLKPSQCIPPLPSKNLAWKHADGNGYSCHHGATIDIYKVVS